MEIMGECLCFDEFADVAFKATPKKWQKYDQWITKTRLHLKQKLQKMPASSHVLHCKTDRHLILQFPQNVWNDTNLACVFSWWRLGPRKVSCVPDVGKSWVSAYDLMSLQMWHWWQKPGNDRNMTHFSDFWHQVLKNLVYPSNKKSEKGHSPVL